MAEGAKKLTKTKSKTQDKDSNPKMESNLYGNDADGVPLKATMKSMESLVASDSVALKDCADLDDSLVSSQSKTMPDYFGELSKESSISGKLEDSRSSFTEGNDKPKYTPWFLSDDKDSNGKEESLDKAPSWKDGPKLGDEDSEISSKTKDSDSRQRDRSSKLRDVDSKFGDDNDPFPLSDKKEQIITYDWVSLKVCPNTIMIVL